MDYSLFAVSAPGLEPYTARELQRLKMSDVKAIPGGVEFCGARSDVYRANLHLRTAGRVLLRLGEFYAAAFSELRQKAGRLAWERFLAPGQPVAIKATCHKSKLYHSDAVAERVVGAIGDRLGQSARRHKGGDETELPAAAQLIVVRVDHDRCLISVDTSGALLHQRGYRLATAKAPLRETLAAGMLFASAWDAAAPLLDPFCGAGTIAVEAALLAQGLAPGRARRFAFMGWPDFEVEAWQSLLAEADSQSTSVAPPILASDRDGGAIDAACANAERAGVGGSIEFTRRAVSAIEPPGGPGWVVTNPPYGVRVSQRHDLRNLYAQFGHVLRAKCAGWHVALLTNSAELQAQVGLEFDRGVSLVNGGLKVKLVRGTVSLPQ